MVYRTVPPPGRNYGSMIKTVFWSNNLPLPNLNRISVKAQRHNHMIFPTANAADAVAIEEG